MISRARGLAASVALALAASLSPASAQSPLPAAAEPPPPAIKPFRSHFDPSRTFWFHRPGIDAATARTDIEYCLLQSSAIYALRRPRQNPVAFTAVEAAVSGVSNRLARYAEGEEVGPRRDAALRKCMGLYGYDPYYVPELEWIEMMGAPDAVERLTAFATGPVPSTRKLER